MKPRIGPAIYLALDGVSHIAAIITQVEDNGTVHVTTFPPGSPQPVCYSRIEFSEKPKAGTVRPN